MTITSSTLAMNLPVTICHSWTGLVSSSSMVPVRCSSAIRRMLIIGTTNRNSTLTFEISPRSDASREDSMINPNSRPAPNRKKAMTRYASGDRK